MSEGDKDRCICCGAEFVDGKGFIEPHTCQFARERRGWAWTIKDSERKMYVDEQAKVTETQWNTIYGLMQVAALRLVPHRSNDRAEHT